MEQCPICYTKLEVRDCSPCDDCGCNPVELEHFEKKIHKYTTYKILNIERLTLCNFCEVDFGSYLSEFLGENFKKIDLKDFEFIGENTNSTIVKDKVCPECNRRLKFLNFVIKVKTNLE